MRKYQQPYPVEFKAQILELLQLGNRPKDLAKEFGCDVTTIRDWARQANLVIPKKTVAQEGSLGLREREELQRLRQENKRLRMERDILAKATAWFAQQGKAVAK
jgi:transposase